MISTYLWALLPHVGHSIMLWPLVFHWIPLPNGTRLWIWRHPLRPGFSPCLIMHTKSMTTSWNLVYGVPLSSSREGVDPNLSKPIDFVQPSDHSFIHSVVSGLNNSNPSVVIGKEPYLSSPIPPRPTCCAFTTAHAVVPFRPAAN